MTLSLLLLACADAPRHRDRGDTDTAPDSPPDPADTGSDTGSPEPDELSLPEGAWSSALVTRVADAYVGRQVLVSDSLGGRPGTWIYTWRDDEHPGTVLAPMPAAGVLEVSDPSVIRLGISVNVLADVDGDGVDDIVSRDEIAVAEDPDYPEYGITQTLSAWNVFYGPVTGPVDPSTPDATFDGVWSDYGKTPTFAVGDVTDDGGEDVLVHQGYHSYEVRLLPSSGALAWEDAVPVAASGQYIRASGVGDVTGDGVDDLVLRMDSASRLFAGPITGAVSASDAVGAFPSDTWYVYGGGDQDGDGYGEVLAEADDEEVRVYAGPIGPTIGEDTPAATIAAADGNFYVHAIAQGADADGDGRADVLVGGARDGAHVWLFDGPLVGAVEPDSARYIVDVDRCCGEDLAFGPDLDGDGARPFIVGDYGFDDLANDAGAVFLFDPEATAGAAAPSPE